jgi:hypothetical protein
LVQLLLSHGSCAVYFWSDIKAQLDDHIVSTVQNDFNLRDKSRLLDSIRTIISSDISSNKGVLFDSVDSTYHKSLSKVFGEIVYGTVTLDNLKASTKIQFFVPPKHKGFLRMQVGYLPANTGIRVVAEESGLWGIVCDAFPVVYPLDKFLEGKEDAERNVVESARGSTDDSRDGSRVEAVEDSEYFRSLYTLTLTLRHTIEHGGRKCKEALPSSKQSSDEHNDSGEELPRPVEITYISAISPPVETDELR